jgi:hypothetical protein
MSRLVKPLPMVLAVLSGCTCGNKPSSSPSEAAPVDLEAAVPAPPPLPSVETPEVFSAPIAAARVAHGNVVAGFVAAEGVMRVMRVADQDGGTAWTADALHDLAWGPDLDLQLLPAGDDVALVWRKPYEGSALRSLLVLGGVAGVAREDPLDIGSSYCATTEGLAWLEPQAGGPTRVRARPWSSASVGDVIGLAAERDASLVCGDHAVIVLGEGEDNTTATSFLPSERKAPPPVVAIRDSDFGDDDERERRAYSLGDDLGLAWVGDSGTIMLRDVPRGGVPSRWRRLKHALDADDDVVAVDGDAQNTYVVYTRGVDDACPDVSVAAMSVRVVVADRASGTDRRLDLAPPSCDRSPGPFWIAPAPGGSVIAWVERAAKLDAAAPVVGVALRRITGDTVRASQIDVAADAVVDAGCDERACFVAALLRPADTDGSLPAPIRLIPYP